MCVSQFDGPDQEQPGKELPSLALGNWLARLHLHLAFAWVRTGGGGATRPHYCRSAVTLEVVGFRVLFFIVFFVLAPDSLTHHAAS